MLLTEIMALAAAALCVAFTAYVALKSNDLVNQKSWILPALASMMFAVFSGWAAIVQGPLGFWIEHSARELWGNQIFFDLLLASSIAWVLIVPGARKLGMVLPLWLAIVLATGSIGLLAMMARLLFLQARAQPRV